MSVTIDHSLVELTITHRPSVNPPTVAAGQAQFQSERITASGQAVLTGGAGDSPAGWTLGFIQVEWIETNWVYYRGQTRSDGSVFVQRARPPARPTQAYRDTVGPVGDVLYNTRTGAASTAPAGTALPAVLRATHYDKPADQCDLVRTNNTTSRPNFLREAQFEFHFCAVLTARDPTGVYHHLKHFYWNVHWQCTFVPSSFSPGASPSWSVIPAGRGNSGNVSRVFDGPPSDRRFAGVLTGAQSANANDVAGAEETHPIVRDSSTWRDFDVRM